MTMSDDAALRLSIEVAVGVDRAFEVFTNDFDRIKGQGWQGLRGGLEAPDGWPLYLDRYSELVAKG